MSIWIGNLLYHLLNGVIIHFALIPLPHMSHLITFLVKPLPYKHVTFFLNGPWVFRMIMLFGFLSFEVPTSREEIFAGTNFRKFCFWIFLGNDFRYLEFIKDITGIDIHGHDFCKDYEGINFSMTLFCGFEKSTLFTCKNYRNNRWSREDIIHKYQTESLVFGVH